VTTATSHDQGANDTSVIDSFDLFVKDSDGDTAANTLEITVVDDEPGIGDPQDAILTNETGNSATGDLDITFGADGPSTTTDAIQLGAPPVDGDGHAVDNGDALLTSDGTPLIYLSDGSGGWIAVTDDTAQTPVFTVSVDAVAETYSVNIVGLLDGAPVPFDVDLATGDHTGGNDFVAQFEVDIDGDAVNDVRVTATAATDVLPLGTAKVNFNANSVGVDTGNDINGDDGDLLHVEFTDPADDSYLTVETVNVELDNFSHPNPETAYVQAYIHDGANLVAVGSPIVFTGPPSTFEVSPGGEFDTLEFTAAEGTTYKVATISGIDSTEAADHTVTFDVTVEDGDGDTDFDTFDVTFDGDGILNGDTGESEVIVGGSGVDTIYADDDTPDIIDGGAGADIIDIDGTVGDTIDTLVNPDVTDDIT
jgi:hypothetical protein